MIPRHILELLCPFGEDEAAWAQSLTDGTARVERRGRDAITEWFVIWSIEHNAWWAPHHRGYVRDVERAGRYGRDEARAIVKNANVVNVEECMIPVECIEPELE